MSSGSYLTIYRKHHDEPISHEVVESVANEYFLANKKELFGSKKDDEQLKDDIPILMDLKYKSEHSYLDDIAHYEYVDINGFKYGKLLEFHFGSSFSCLKDEFSLDAYSFKRCSTFISKHDAEKMLQAINYILSNNYNKEFENVLSNKYVKVFGEDYSPFANRFSNNNEPIYVDKNAGNFKITYGDYEYDAEIAEDDANVEFNLKKAKSCLDAFLQAEDNSWDKQELVLEYSVYG